MGAPAGGLGLPPLRLFRRGRGRPLRPQPARAGAGRHRHRGGGGLALRTGPRPARRAARAVGLGLLDAVRGLVGDHDHLQRRARPLVGGGEHRDRLCARWSPSACCSGPRSRARPSGSGIALGAVAVVVALYALAAKALPDGDRARGDGLSRLREPLGYWNALALVCVTGALPLLRAAATSHYRGPRAPRRADRRASCCCSSLGMTLLARRRARARRRDPDAARADHRAHADGDPAGVRRGRRRGAAGRRARAAGPRRRLRVRRPSARTTAGCCSPSSSCPPPCSRSGRAR